jgi:hypothetical protein
VEDDAFVDFVDTRVQRRRATDVEVKYLGTRLIADGKEVSEASCDKESDLREGWEIKGGGSCELGVDLSSVAL